MRIDELSTLVSEEWTDDNTIGFQGNRGESMAVTSRIVDLYMILGEPTTLDLTKFITDKGTCRHPLSQWREDNESSDQAVTHYMAALKQQPGLANEMFVRIKGNGWRTGNGNIVSLAFYALLTNKQWLLNLALVGQMAIFKFPWRYNEEKKAMEPSKNSSADWMNFIHQLYYASPWVKKMVDVNTLNERVRHYFSREPNVSWIILLYGRAIGVMFR